MTPASPVHPPLLSPSLLSCDFGRLREELEALEAAGLSWVHWDVMDGRFVPNITLGPPLIRACRKGSSLFFDVHLMIVEPEKYVEAFADAGADLICVHAEACTHLERVLAQIKATGKQAAVSLNPHTPLNVLEYVLPQCDMVLLMSVNPGFGGQKFLEFTYRKLIELRAMCRRLGCWPRVQVDGGVTPSNAGALVNSGADVLVSGSAFFAFPPYYERHQLFQQAMRG
ncbi:ribulose-phosphate 3-epimerase [Megalodesulfovibrio paquesii]